MEKLELCGAALSGIETFLRQYQSITNCHNSDFLSKDLWSLLPSQVATDLEEVDDWCDIPRRCVQLRQHGSALRTSLFGPHLSAFLVNAMNCSLEATGVLSPAPALTKVSKPLEMLAMGEKKWHEVERLAAFTTDQCQKLALTSVVDVGSGKGYLGSHLSLQAGISVLEVDSEKSNTDGAEVRRKKLKKRWRKCENSKRGTLENVRRNKINHENTEDLNISNRSQQNDLTDLRVNENYACGKSTESFRNACCQKNADFDRRESAEYVEDLTHIGTVMEDEKIQKGNVLSITDRIDSAIQLDALVTRHLDGPSAVIGLHTCGYLAMCAIKTFLESRTAQLLINVGCCYHLLDERGVSETYIKHRHITDAPTFPMSRRVANGGIVLGRNSRMVAQQSVERMAEEKELHPHIFYRVLLQQLLKEKLGFCDDNWIVGKLSRKPESLNFLQYVRKALMKLNFERISNQMTDEEIKLFANKWSHVRRKFQLFYVLRSSIGCVVEAYILIDRLCYILEEKNDKKLVSDARLVRIFDPLRSPRCYALVAEKDLDMS